MSCNVEETTRREISTRCGILFYHLTGKQQKRVIAEFADIMDDSITNSVMDVMESEDFKMTPRSINFEDGEFDINVKFINIIPVRLTVGDLQEIERIIHEQSEI